jgi:hypothetical protein
VSHAKLNANRGMKRGAVVVWALALLVMGVAAIIAVATPGNPRITSITPVVTVTETQTVVMNDKGFPIIVREGVPQMPEDLETSGG